MVLFCVSSVAGSALLADCPGGAKLASLFTSLLSVGNGCAAAPGFVGFCAVSEEQRWHADASASLPVAKEVNVAWSRALDLGSRAAVSWPLDLLLAWPGDFSGAFDRFTVFPGDRGGVTISSRGSSGMGGGTGTEEAVLAVSVYILPSLMLSASSSFLGRKSTTRFFRFLACAFGCLGELIPGPADEYDERVLTEAALEVSCNALDMPATCECIRERGGLTGDIKPSV